MTVGNNQIEERDFTPVFTPMVQSVSLGRIVLGVFLGMMLAGFASAVLWIGITSLLHATGDLR